jgi:hypothetical protein
VCVRGSGLRGPLAFGPARGKRVCRSVLLRLKRGASIARRFARIGPRGIFLESATLAEPTGFLHVSRAKVGARDATRPMAIRHVIPRSRQSWPAAGMAGGLRKVLGSAPAHRAGRRHAAGTVPGPAETWLPAGVGQQHKIRGSALHAHMARPSPCGLGLHARGITHGSPSPEQLEVAGRATDDARTAHADLGSWATEQARGTLLSGGRPPGDGAAGIERNCSRGLYRQLPGEDRGQVGIGASAFAVRRGTGGDSPNRVRTWAWRAPCPVPGRTAHATATDGSRAVRTGCVTARYYDSRCIWKRKGGRWREIGALASIRVCTKGIVERVI